MADLRGQQERGKAKATTDRRGASSPVSQPRSRRLSSMPGERRQYGRRVSVPQKKGIRVETIITINRPVPEVYGFWRRLENLPLFMRHLESVTLLSAAQSRWRVRSLAGTILEWDAEVIEEKENQMLSWRSLPGADVGSAGSVWFTPVPGGQGTIVRVLLKYQPPGGKAAAMVAKLFGEDAESEIEADLKQLKSMLER